MNIRQVEKERQRAIKAEVEARQKFENYQAVMSDIAGINITDLAKCKEIRTSYSNVAGVNIPVFEDAVFQEARYSLFGTPAWVDTALMDLREINKWQAALNILQQQHDLLQKELTKIVQRVNLFEKVKIPDSKENIRRIRIRLGDEMTSAVGRAKIAKNKLDETADQAG